MTTFHKVEPSRHPNQGRGTIYLRDCDANVRKWVRSLRAELRSVEKHNERVYSACHPSWPLMEERQVERAIWAQPFLVPTVYQKGKDTRLEVRMILLTPKELQELKKACHNLHIGKGHK